MKDFFVHSFRNSKYHHDDDDYDYDDDNKFLMGNPYIYIESEKIHSFIHSLEYKES